MKGRGRLGRDMKQPCCALRIRRYATRAVLAMMGAWLMFGSVAYPLPAALPERPGISAAGALICFYRHLGDSIGGDDYSVVVGERNLGKLAPGTYLYHYTSPGRRIAWVKGAVSVSRTLVVNEGDRLYVRIDRKAFVAGYRPGFTLVKPDKATRQMRGSSFAGVDPMADPTACG